ncbi:Na(+)/H(+) antiporter subunit B [Sinomonas sp. P10A9]|uniref:Na(+)/H(+) antiporter subunit B n=1 Tax=Sinomonas puerhi TaxID=3238584 RepID=A0AB39L7F7_9MICC
MSEGILTDVLIAVSLTLVLAGAAIVVFVRRPARQAVALSAYGVLLTVLFLVLQAPDVALSQVAVGSAVVPLIVVLAIRKVESIHANAGSRDAEREH